VIGDEENSTETGQSRLKTFMRKVNRCILGYYQCKQAHLLDLNRREQSLEHASDQLEVGFGGLSSRCLEVVHDELYQAK
jgi:hypothetical protein